MEFNNLTLSAPTINADDTNVVLTADTSGIKGYDKQEKAVETAMGYARTMTNTLVRENHTAARNIFDENEGVQTVEANLNFGGIELNATCHRSFQDGDNEPLTYFSQVQATTGLGLDVLDVIKTIDDSASDEE